MSAPDPPSAVRAGPRRWPWYGRSPVDLGAATVGVLLGLPLAVVAFSVTVTFAALAVGLLVVYPVALPVVVAWTAAVRGFAAAERRRIATFHGWTIAAPATPPDAGTRHSRLWRHALHHTTWRAFGHQLLQLPVAVISFSLVLAALAIPLMLLALPLQLLLTGASLASGPVLLLAGGGVVAGIALALFTPAVVSAVADLDAAIAGRLLGPSDRDRLDARVGHLTATRSQMVDIAESERRRIERDLHDGAGQQLVSLAMTIGMAREKLTTDPDDARDLIDEAHAEAKRALSELRDLVRGISPAILTDRGLGAALAAVAGRSQLPVTLVVEVPERPDAAIEGIAYYLVCEALSNSVRHADASRLDVSVVQRDNVLEVAVTDDGRGGADPTRGTGLAGLAGRVAAVDGSFELSSPAGGPTTVRAHLPVRAGDTASGDPVAGGR